MSDDFSSLPPSPENPYVPPTAPLSKPLPSSQRRDGLILGLGIGGILMTVLGALFGFLCCLFWPIVGVGTIMGGISAILGFIDLKAIREGRLDPRAEGQTRIGMILGIVSVVLAVLAVLGMIAIAVFFGVMENTASF